MNQKRVSDILSDARQKQPLIHCITNPISINQCANTILAVGGRPMMAEHPKETQEITQTAQTQAAQLKATVNEYCSNVLNQTQEQLQKSFNEVKLVKDNLKK